MSCTGNHGYVVASGRCSACHEPVVASGPLGVEDFAPGYGWQAATDPDPDTAGECPASGLNHVPDTATGTCADCSTRLESVLWGAAWFETQAQPTT